MASTPKPNVYTIAAHRGYADALVAGLVPRYFEDEFGLARLTLLVPSSRSVRTISEAFIRHFGAEGKDGLLMPRMVTVGDLDLDESLGHLLDPLDAEGIPPAVDPMQRMFELSGIIKDQMGKDAPDTRVRLRMAKDMARAMDRVLVEDVAPADLVGDLVKDMLGSLSEHWIASLRQFVGVQDQWLNRLSARGQVDAATRRNMLFDRAVQHWRNSPPKTPIISAGVTSASPALARMLRAIANCDNGAVILPDLDLSISNEAWDELGRAGQSPEPGEPPFGSDDALTHPQYHLKLLLNRMGVAREEVQHWHRKGLSAAPPSRTHAISSLFLPPKASRSWVDLPSEKRRMSGIRLMTLPTQEEEAQATAMLVRQALETPEHRIAVVTADRSLARRVAQHLLRWNIVADDTAGRPLSLLPAGRLFSLIAQCASEGFGPQNLIATLAHPLVMSHDIEARRDWLVALRKFERELRGPAPAPGFDSMRNIAEKAKVSEWWKTVEGLLAPLVHEDEHIAIVDALTDYIAVAESLAGDAIWSRTDGRALARLIDDLRLHAGEHAISAAPKEMGGIVRDALDDVAVRPQYGGHPRVAIYGLLEARMVRADVMICCGLNEGSWPQAPSPDALLAPGILRALGVPGAEFRIGLSAHDLAGVMGAPQVVLSRSQRDSDGPTIPSRFWLRVEALLGELAKNYREEEIPALALQIDRHVAQSQPDYERPAPDPSAELRRVNIKVTALDKLLGDPYQFYAQEILRLRSLEDLAADPFNDPRLRGTLAHTILEEWHKARKDDPQAAIKPVADRVLKAANAHPLLWGLWRPRLMAALEHFVALVEEAEKEGRTVAACEIDGGMSVGGVRIYGRADRIDLLPDGRLAIVDYKTGKPPTANEVGAGYALQLGLLGLIARDGDFKSKDGAVKLTGDAASFEYWSMARDGDEFGYIYEPIKTGSRIKGLLPEEFLPAHEEYLDQAITRYITGDAPFMAKENPDYPGYNEYDQLMRLEEWQVQLNAAPADNDDQGDAS